jgi:hypothetical protein
VHIYIYIYIFKISLIEITIPNKPYDYTHMNHSSASAHAHTHIYIYIGTHKRMHTQNTLTKSAVDKFEGSTTFNAHVKIIVFFFLLKQKH